MTAMFINVKPIERPTRLEPVYPRTTVHRIQPGVWVTDDGYRIVRHVITYALNPDCVEFYVYLPGGTHPSAWVELMREARETICAWRETDNRCGHPHLTWKG